MKGLQLQAYDAVLEGFRARRATETCAVLRLQLFLSFERSLCILVFVKRQR